MKVKVCRRFLRCHSDSGSSRFPVVTQATVPTSGTLRKTVNNITFLTRPGATTRWRCARPIRVPEALTAEWPTARSTATRCRRSVGAAEILVSPRIQRVLDKPVCRWHHILTLNNPAHRPPGVSDDRLHGNHGDWRQRAWLAPPGRRLCLHQEVLHPAEEEEAGLCPGL